jgi:hypothetical protein
MTNPLASRLAPGLLAFLLLASLTISCDNRPSERTELVPGEEGGTDSAFVAQAVSVPATDHSQFLSYLEICYHPVWNDLLNRGTLREVNVFELSEIQGSADKSPEWSHLLVAEVNPSETDGRLLLDDGSGLESCDPARKPLFSIIRTEVLSKTPDSYYPMPAPELRGDVKRIDFLIELIAVEDSKEALKEYRDLMQMYFGPANGQLVEDGVLFNFVALETEQVISEASGIPTWNQIHISGDFPENAEVDWDSVYEDLFLRIFSIDLDTVWARVPDISEHAGDYSGRLVQTLGGS